MIDNSTLLKTKSNVTFRPATISKNTGAIFSIMTESVYSLPRLAGCREIISNALDATTRAKSDRPIEIKAPTTLSPSFSVRDFGPGLDAQEIEDLYTCLGASSKKDVENEIGFFGIGALSPLAYVEQFTVQSFKNGQLDLYSIFAGEDGVPKVAPISSSKTNEPNGMCVSYVVKREELSRFWEDMNFVLTYIESNKYICTGFNKVITYYKNSLKTSKDLTINFNDNIFITKNNWNNNRKNFIVMGGVCYEFDPTWLKNSLFNSHSLTIEAPIGAVSVQASREKLRMNAKTTAYIEAVVKFISNNLESELQKQIDGAKTFLEALVIKEQMTIMQFHKIKWNKYELTMKYFLEEMSKYFDVKTKSGKAFFLYGSPDYQRKIYHSPSSSHRFLLDDTSQGGLVRVLANDLYYSNVSVCVEKDSAKTQEFIKNFGNFFTERTSNLPAPAKKASVAKVKTKKYLLSKGVTYHTTFNNCTTEFKGDYDKFDGYYVRMKSRSIIYGDKKIALTDIYDVRNFVDKEIMIIDWEEEAFPEKAECFLDYFIKNIQQEKEKCWNQNIYDKFLRNNSFDLLNQCRKDFQKAISKYNQKSKLSSLSQGNDLIKSLGIVVSQSGHGWAEFYAKINEKIDNIIEKHYPLLQVLTYSAYHEPYLSNLKKYLSEGDQSVFDSCFDCIVQS